MDANQGRWVLIDEGGGCEHVCCADPERIDVGVTVDVVSWRRATRARPGSTG